MLPCILVLALTWVSLSSQQCLTPRDEIRKIRGETEESLLQSELQFSLDLVHTVSSLQPDENLFFSPSSVFKAMLLAYFISANHTEESLKKALHLPSDEDKLDVMGGYTLQSYYEKLRSSKSHSYQLSNANRLYVAKKLKVQHCMKVLFAEEIQPADFQNNAIGVLRKINNWVSERTRKVIKDFLSEDQISQNTELVLVNAAYFKGDWKYKFDEESTRKHSFHLSNGTTVKTKMMRQENMFKTKMDKKLGAEVAELPYMGDDISMLVLMPLNQSPSAIQELVKKIEPETLQDLVDALNSSKPFKQVVVIPKFTIDKSLQLTQILESMGVGDLFQQSADLSTLVKKGGLSFSEATHKAKLRVDEEGSEAAAATAIISSRMSPPEFIADSPFVYILYDKISNLILFFGIFYSPE